MSHDGVGTDSEESLEGHRDSRVQWKEREVSLRTLWRQWWHRAGGFAINTGPTGLLGAARPKPSGEGSLMGQRLQEEAWRVTSHYVFRATLPSALIQDIETAIRHMRGA